MRMPHEVIGFSVQERFNQSGQACGRVAEVPLATMGCSKLVHVTLSHPCISRGQVVEAEKTTTRGYPQDGCTWILCTGAFHQSGQACGRVTEVPLATMGFSKLVHDHVARSPSVL